MSAIVIADTTTLLNIFGCPGRCDNQADVIDQLQIHIEEGDFLFVPLAAIIECGNHIAQAANGHERRKAASRFAQGMQDALNDIAPWKPIGVPRLAELASWLIAFPENAAQGIGLGDTSIIEEFNQSCVKYPLSRVLIWSLDGDLDGYDRNPRKRPIRRLPRKP